MNPSATALNKTLALLEKLQKYESGTNRITASRLVLIGLALRVPLVDLVNGMGL